MLENCFLLQALYPLVLHWHKVMVQKLPELLGLWPKPFHSNQLLVDALGIHPYQYLTSVNN